MLKVLIAGRRYQSDLAPFDDVASVKRSYRYIN